jgi:hypothetical protein
VTEEIGVAMMLGVATARPTTSSCTGAAAANPTMVQRARSLILSTPSARKYRGTSSTGIDKNERTLASSQSTQRPSLFPPRFPGSRAPDSRVKTATAC